MTTKDIVLGSVDLRKYAESRGAKLIAAPDRFACPWRPGADSTGFVVGDKLWFDHTTSEGGDAISFVERMDGCDFKTALATLAKFVGIEAEGKVEPWRRLLNEAKEDPGRVSEYLKHRGLSGDVHGLLFVASAYYDKDRRFPCMVASVQDVDSNPMGIHRTFLDPAGLGKAKIAPGEDAKRMLGSVKGGAVRFGEVDPANGLLFICEGIETTVAIHEATGIATWATLSTSGMKAVVLPAEVTRVVIAADNDAAGKKAARVTAERLVSEGRAVRIATPEAKGDDFLDVLVKHGVEAVKARIAAAVAVEAKVEKVQHAESAPPAPTTTGHPFAGGRKQIILPGNGQEINATARELFPLLKDRGGLFYRSGGLYRVEVDRGLVEVDAADFASLPEHVGQVFAIRLVDGSPSLRPAVCSKATAELVMATEAARDILPSINRVATCPIFIEDGSTIKALGKGYHALGGGVYVLGGECNTEIPLDDARNALLAIHDGYLFPTENDKGRALAMMVSPALQFGGILGEECPAEVAEAREKQTGKNHRQETVRLTYGSRSPAITMKEVGEGGVGGLGESVAAVLVAGNPFVVVSNIRGPVRSQLIEEAIRGAEYVSCRIPHRKPVDVPTRNTCWQFSSNGCEFTPDLAARCCIVRQIKQPPDYIFRHYSEGSLHAHIRANQPYYLGCVHTIIRHWVEAGKPLGNTARHDMRRWAGAMDWIISEVFGIRDFLADFADLRSRIADSRLCWLRAVAIRIEASGRAGGWMRASDILDYCEDEAAIPNLKAGADDKTSCQVIGRMMNTLFNRVQAEEIAGEGFRVERMRESSWRDDGKGERETKKYRFEVVK